VQCIVELAEEALVDPGCAEYVEHASALFAGHGVVR
jgi:hypothetical protein